MKRKIIISLVAAGGIVFSFFQFKYLASKTTTSDAVEVEHYTIAPAETIFINGLIEPIETTQITIDPSKGSVNKTYVTDGQIVEKGDLLFEYLNSSITEQIAQLDIQMESHYKEIEQLKKKKENSKQKLAEQKKNLKEQERLAKEQQKQAEEQQRLAAEQQKQAEEQQRLAAEQQKQAEEQQKLVEEQQKQVEEQQKAAEEASKKGELFNLEWQQESEGQYSKSTQQLGFTTSDLSGMDASVFSGEVAAIENEISAFDEQITSIQNQVATVEKQKGLLKKKEVIQETAPIDGRITLNDMDNTQSPYISIESTEYYVNGMVGERDLSKLEIGQQSEVLVHSTNENITGAIEFIGDRPLDSDLSANMVNGNSNVSNYVVKIKLDSQENLMNGYHVQANVKLSGTELKIPRKAILEEKGNSYVYKVKGKEYIKQVITYSDEDSEENSDEASVIGGLKENDKIVLNPSSAIGEKEGIKNE